LIEDFEEQIDKIDLENLGFEELIFTNQEQLEENRQDQIFANDNQLVIYYDNENNQTIIENFNNDFRIELNGDVLLSEEDFLL